MNKGIEMRRAILVILPLLCACDSEAEKAVRRSMLDPDATQFRDVRQCSGDKSVWRGEANGKNSFGAYTGFKPFFYAEGSVAYAGDAGFTPMMDRCYSDLPDAKASASGLPQPSPPTATASPDKATPASVAAAGGEPMHSDEEDSPEAIDRCWMDYCPCDTSNPDYGYADIPICRNLRAGLPADARLMSAGAAARDARRSLREFKEEDQGYRRPSAPRPSPSATSYEPGRSDSVAPSQGSNAAGTDSGIDR